MVIVGIGLALVWILLNRGEVASFLVGIPAILLGVWLSSLLPAQPRWSVPAGRLIGFAPFFLQQSLLGGWDVARRALRTKVAVEPGFVTHDLRLAPGPARIFFLDAITLLPGTLSAELVGDQVEVHAIDLSQPIATDLCDLEQRVAGLFGGADVLA